MKKILIISAIFLSLTMPLILFAQNPPHPNGGNAPTTTNAPVGGGAPIGNETYIFLVLAASYLGFKTLKQREVSLVNK